MKSSHFVLFCFAVYLCSDGVTSKRHFSQEDDNFLKDGNRWRTEKNEFARKLRNPANMRMKFKNNLDYFSQRTDPDKCSAVVCQNEGKCEIEGGKAVCKCTDQFTGDSCETDKCSAVVCQNEGKCEIEGGKAVCKCTDQFTGDSCETAVDGGCKSKKPNCEETGGLCIPGKENDQNIICKCPTGTEYKEHTGCKVLEETCKHQKPKCTDTEGSCFSDNKGIVQCKCPENTMYDVENGCKAANFCIDACGDKPGVVCTGDVTVKSKVKCECEDEKKIFDKKECKVDQCLEVCGISHGEKSEELSCVGGPFGKVECKCTDDKLKMDPEDKTCKTDHCPEKCGSVKCEGNSFDEDSIKCNCEDDNKDFIDDEKTCKINYCRKVCGSKEGVECEEKEKYNDKITVNDCKCDEAAKVFYKGECKEKCSGNDECKNTAQCKTKGNYMFCDCLKGTTGDFCETITDCEDKYKKCQGDRGECKYIAGKKSAECICPKDTILDEAVGYCSPVCEEDVDCDKGTVCGAKKFCVCPEGHEGDECEIVSGCKTLEKECKEKDAKCIWDKNDKKATCQCNKKGFIYVEAEKVCKDPFCVNSPCKKTATCKYDEPRETGYCQCSDGKYYNYNSESCEDLPDKCILKKKECGENKMCVKGTCVCKDGFKADAKDKNKCAPKCSCFMECGEDGSCSCKSGTFFKDASCKDAKCDWTDYEAKCPCPEKFERKTGSEECVPKKDAGEECGKECGYGKCIKKTDKEECKCFKPFFKLDKETCILDKTVCATNELEKDSLKCNCTGKYTHADDGISCRLLTCEEDMPKTDCANKGGMCQMQWKRGNGREAGYFCLCPVGFKEDENGKCRDTCNAKEISGCSETGRICQAYTDKQRKQDCQCPPTLEADEDTKKCSVIAKYARIIRNIPVIKKRYEMKSGINTPLLNGDLMQSMKQAFSAIYKYGYLQDYTLVGSNGLNCSMWVHFSKDPTSELARLQLQAQKFKIASCTDCLEDAIVLPPYLRLDADHLKEISSEKVDLCTPTIKNSLCGVHSVCKDNRCSCPKGFSPVDFTIRLDQYFVIQRCEDNDECSTGSHECSGNTTCVNVAGDYRCDCKPGYKKQKPPTDPKTDKSACYDVCTPSPCKKGTCSHKDGIFDCTCESGVGGSYCHRADENYARAKKGTVAVGAVLGVLLALGLIAFFLYYRKMKKSSGSEDFVASPRMDRAEMTERRPMRGVVNKSYE